MKNIIKRNEWRTFTTLIIIDTPVEL